MCNYTVDHVDREYDYFFCKESCMAPGKASPGFIDSVLVYRLRPTNFVHYNNLATAYPRIVFTTSPSKSVWPKLYRMSKIITD